MKKTIIFLTILVLFVSLTFLLFINIRENSMDSYEYDERRLGIAVSRLMTSKSVVHNFGKPIYPENRELQYVWVYISLINSGAEAINVRPEEFTLSLPGKAPVKYDTSATGSMQKCLKEIALEPGEENVGVLIFPLRENSTYILHYSGPQGKIEKKLTTTIQQ